MHHRSGFPLNKLAELHGNMFFTMCNQCQTKVYFKESLFSFNLKNYNQLKRLTGESVKTVGLKPIGKKCTKEKQRGICR